MLPSETKIKVSWIVSLVLYSVADLGEGPGGPRPSPLILGEKKEEMTEGRKVLE